MATLREKLINEISLKNSIVKLISAWFIFALILLIKGPNHTDLSFNQNISVFVSIIFIILIFGLLYGLSVILFKYKIDSKTLFISTILFITALILNYETMEIDDYRLIGIAAISIIIFLYCFYDNKYLFDGKNIDFKKALITLSIISLVSFLIAFITLILRYKSYLSPNFDFGIFVNSFYNIKRGGAPIIGCERDILQSHFCVHLSPILYVVFPLFFIFPSPITVQFLQAFSVSVSIVPLVLLMKEKKLSNNLILLIGILFAFYPALNAVSFYDFHENCFLTFIILFLIYFMEKKKYVPFYIFLILLFSVKEDAAFYSFVLGLFMIFNKKNYVSGSITSVLSVIYFIIAVTILSKIGSGAMYDRFDNLIYNNTGLFGAIKTIINNPGYAFEQLFLAEGNLGAKLVYFINLFMPLCLIPLVIKKPSHLILLMPCLLNFLTLYPYQTDIRFQYNFGITAFLFYLVILNINDISINVKEKLLVMSLSTTFVFYLGFGALLFLDTARYRYYLDSIIKEYDKAVKLIPNDASVSASTIFCPHLSNRKELYEDYYHNNKLDIDYLCVTIDKDYPNSREYKEINYYLDNGYEIYYESDYVMILKHS